MLFARPPLTNSPFFSFIVCSFAPMSGSTGLMRCVIPQGRKDGKKVKGSTFQSIVGVGQQPGENFAALNVLHQVERGKPLERLLAPEFRSVWLGLDKTFQEVEEENVRRSETAERRKKFAERRAKFEKSKESATISISATSRQMIEDALLEQKGSASKETSSTSVPSSSDATVVSPSKAGSIRQELVAMGFAVFDAVDASQMFSSVNEALDYLCLNLDESELPSLFAPTSEVEVVLFQSGSEKSGSRLVRPQDRDSLMRLLRLSKYSVEKALRKSAGDLDLAFNVLYNTLTHNMLCKHFYLDLADSFKAMATEQKSMEEESITAIYGEDAKAGFGIYPEFRNKWAAVIRIQEGFSGITYTKPVTIVVLDIDGFYPFSAPVVLAGINFESNESGKSTLTAAQARVLMRAAASEIVSLRRIAAEDLPSSEPLPVTHGVLSFLCGASEGDLMFTSPRKLQMPSISEHPAEGKSNQTYIKNGSNNSRRFEASGKGRSYRRTKPLQVNALKPSPQLDVMQKRRTSLPAHSARGTILTAVRNNRVVVVSGATGSGKTTQVPQFLLEEATNTREPISIVCTQPRRIAAMSVAERVAAERCQVVGEDVGYQVKLNTKTSAKTRLVFCTTGVLLRRLQADPTLDSLTHVLVDEVHERSVETDFLLLLLREISVARPALKVLLMSATLDPAKFSNYFSVALSKDSQGTEVPVISIPGRTFPVDEYYLADVVKMTSYRLKPGDRYARRTGKVAHKGKYGPEPLEGSIRPPVRNSATLVAAADDPVIDNWDDEPEICGNDTTRALLDTPIERASSSGKQALLEEKRTTSLIDEAIVNIDLINTLVRKIDAADRLSDKMGAILIFVPGVAEISALIRKLTSNQGNNSLWVLPLHSLLSPDQQRKVFSKPPKGMRKVICATNIAETSITVEDVTVVIDTLRAKEMGYDALNGSSVLEEQFISKAAAKQRAGRAGRVSRGTCYRLVRKNTYENRIVAQQIPEIQRVALEHLVLNILSIIPDSQTENDPKTFLSKAVDPPKVESINKAISNLIDIGALVQIENENGYEGAQKVTLTSLGKHLSGLPVDARIGKLLIYGSVFSCMDPALTIAASISERSPFFSPFDKREEARAARQHFVWGKSDLLTFVKAFEAWRDLKENKQGYAAEQAFCNKYFLSRKTLMSIEDGRRQLSNAIADAGFGISGNRHVGPRWERDKHVNQYSTNVRVLKAMICAALYPNIARIDLPDKTYHEVAGGSVANNYHSKDLRLRSKSGERLFLHPESVNFHEGKYETRWLAYFSKVKTSRTFVRDSTMVSPYAILLFGGKITIQHEKKQMTVDGWIVFKSPARVAVLARELRRQLDTLLLRKFEDADINLREEGRAVNDAIIRLITQES